MVSSLWKGVLLGACTVIAIAGALALVTAVDTAHGRYRNVADLFFITCFVGMLPGIGAGALLGQLADQRRTGRRLVLAGTALAVAAIVSILTAPEILWFALPAAAACGLVLERWTRSRAPAGPPSSLWRGAIVGGAAVVAVAIAVGLRLALAPASLGLLFYEYWLPRLPPGMVALSVVFAGLIPGLVTGAGLGWLAERLAAWSPHARASVLGGLALMVVLAAGAATGLAVLVAPAVLPVLAATLVLERWTRRPMALARARVVRT